MRLGSNNQKPRHRSPHPSVAPPKLPGWCIYLTHLLPSLAASFITPYHYLAIPKPSYFGKTTFATNLIHLPQPTILLIKMSGLMEGAKDLAGQEGGQEGSKEGSKEGGLAGLESQGKEAMLDQSTSPHT